MIGHVLQGLGLHLTVNSSDSELQSSPQTNPPTIYLMPPTTTRLSPLLRLTRCFPPLKFRPLPRFYSTTPKNPPLPPPEKPPSLPKALQKYASHFRDRPLSHITSFLILHELTAIVPLGGLFLFFHETRWTPPGLPGEWVVAGTEKFGRYVCFYLFLGDPEADDLWG